MADLEATAEVTMNDTPTEQPTAAEEPQSKKRKIDELSDEGSGEATATPSSEDTPAADDTTPAAEATSEETVAPNGGDSEMVDETTGESAETDEAKDKEKEEVEEEEEDESFEEYVESDDESAELSEEQVKKFLKSASHSAVLGLAEKLVLADLKNEAVIEFCQDSEKSSGNCKVFVRALPHELKDTIFKKTFNDFGKVLEAIIIKDRSTGRSKGFGFVTFSKSRYAARAVEKGTVKMGTREVQCSLAHPKSNQASSHRAAPQRAFYGNPYAAAPMYNRGGPYRY